MSPRILALDTTGEYGSLALLEDERVLEEVLLHSPEGFGHILFSELEALLSRHNVGFNGIDVFASASGPGSFTGVRVGLTAVKGLAEATGRQGGSHLKSSGACVVRYPQIACDGSGCSPWRSVRRGLRWGPPRSLP